MLSSACISPSWENPLAGSWTLIISFLATKKWQRGVVSPEMLEKRSSYSMPDRTFLLLLEVRVNIVVISFETDVLRALLLRSVLQCFLLLLSSSSAQTPASTIAAEPSSAMESHLEYKSTLWSVHSMIRFLQLLFPSSVRKRQLHPSLAPQPGWAG